MDIKTSYIVKEKIIRPFDYATWIMWCFVPIVGFIIGYFQCQRKYILVLENNEGKNYDIRMLMVNELDYYKVEVNEKIVQQDSGSYWAEKEKTYVRINIL